MTEDIEKTENEQPNLSDDSVDSQPDNQDTELDSTQNQDPVSDSASGEMKWYVVHTQTGSEEKAKAGLMSRMEKMGLKDFVEEIIVPTEQVSEIRRGKKSITERKFFPGYIIIKMIMTKDSWYLVKSTPGITGFIGPGRKPTPISKEEVDSILQRTEDTETKPTPKMVFDIGESIRIAQGPFANFNGSVMEVFPDRGKLKVSVSIFGRSTLVELEYWQVEKV